MSKPPSRPKGGPPCKVARNACGMTQLQFALMIGCHLSSVKQWENRTVVPSGPTAKLLQCIIISPESMREMLGHPKQLWDGL